MKKFLALLLALAMTLSLVACGGNNNAANDGDDANANADGDKVYKVAMICDSSISDGCLLYTSPSPRDPKTSRMPSSA